MTDGVFCYNFKIDMNTNFLCKLYKHHKKFISRKVLKDIMDIFSLHFLCQLNLLLWM